MRGEMSISKHSSSALFSDTDVEDTDDSVQSAPVTRSLLFKNTLASNKGKIKCMKQWRYFKSHFPFPH